MPASKNDPILAAKNMLARPGLMKIIREERKRKNETNKLRNNLGGKAKVHYMSFSSNKTNSTKCVKTNAKNAGSKNKTNKTNPINRSMNVYKYQLALPFARTGLHDPQSPSYRNELKKNMRNLYLARSNSLNQMHNRDWFVNQLVKNVWNNKTRRTMPVGITKNNIVNGKIKAVPCKKTRAVLASRSGVKPKPKPTCSSAGTSGVKKPRVPKKKLNNNIANLFKKR